MGKKKSQPSTGADSMPFTFVLEDASGDEHVYEVYYHPASVGWVLSMSIVQTLGPALMATIGDLSEGLLDTIGGMADEEAFEEIKGKFKLDLVQAMEMLGEVDPEDLQKLTWRVLRYASRDGSALMDNRKPSHTFSKAFRANYEELYLCCWEIIKGNRFIPLLSTLFDPEEGEGSSEHESAALLSE